MELTSFDISFHSLIILLSGGLEGEGRLLEQGGGRAVRLFVNPDSDYSVEICKLSQFFAIHHTPVLSRLFVIIFTNRCLIFHFNL